MTIIDIDSSNIHLLEEFIKHDFSPTFRYFQHKTPEEIIKNHCKTILLLTDATPIGYAHIDYDIIHDMYWLGCCVVSHYRNQGIGKTLLQQLTDYYIQSDIDTLHLTVDKHNKHAIQLYTRFGFHIARSTDTIHIMALTKHNVVHIPVSFGEAIDKLTILDIKLSKIMDKRRKDVEKEQTILHHHLMPILTKISTYYDMLKQINLQIWNDQDTFRYSSNEEEKTILCKKIIEDNDARFRIKYKINHILSSMVKEQKGYEPTIYSIYYKDLEYELYLDKIILYQSIFNDITQVYCNKIVEERLRNKFIHDPSIIVISEDSSKSNDESLENMSSIETQLSSTYIQTLTNDIKNKIFFNYIMTAL